MESTHEAPKWDMTVVFPSVGSAEFEAEYTQLNKMFEELERVFDLEGIQASTPSKPEDGATFERVFPSVDEFNERLNTFISYIYSFISTDSTDSEAQAALGRAETLMAGQRKLERRFQTWMGTRNLSEVLASSPTAKAHQFTFERAQKIAQHSMSSAEEALAADLGTTGPQAWDRMYGDVTSQIRVTFSHNGSMREETMPTVRALAYDGDRSLREAAYFAELDAWKRFETPCAAAMNAIKGTVNILTARRQWKSPLEEAVFENFVDEQTLDAMMGASRAMFPKLRKYLQAKAKLVANQDRCDWFDMFAPIGGGDSNWTWDRGSKFVVDQFRTFSNHLSDFAQRTIDEQWVDAAPAKNKRDGAFCMPLRKDESRVFQTWKPSFGAVSTFAHELGHAYHNLCLFGRTSLQRETPSTLAETASIFCEQIVANAAIESATGQEKLAILEQGLQRDVQVIIDISSRFLFEKEVFDRRRNSTLSPSDLCDIMLWAQDETYGDGLSENRHAYMWAVKPHYYSTGSFYNFPYMFGLLFSLGLYAKYKETGESFLDQYVNLLSSTGMGDAASLADRFGFDIKTPAFWESSLQVVADSVDQFVSLTH